VAVQWHPEALVDNCPRTRRLFESFIEAASDYREQRSFTNAAV
jgi:gamma-glutamyl-gamma-aminobutyrate hydrolase PuuD